MSQAGEVKGLRFSRKELVFNREWVWHNGIGKKNSKCLWTSEMCQMQCIGIVCHCQIQHVGIVCEYIGIVCQIQHTGTVRYNTQELSVRYNTQELSVSQIQHTGIVCQIQQIGDVCRIQQWKPSTVPWGAHI